MFGQVHDLECFILWSLSCVALTGKLLVYQIPYAKIIFDIMTSLYSEWILTDKAYSLFRILENIHTSECLFKIIFIHCSAKMKMQMLSEILLRGEWFLLNHRYALWLRFLHPFYVHHLHVYLVWSVSHLLLKKPNSSSRMQERHSKRPKF